MEKTFVRYPNFRSSTRNSDPCIKSKEYFNCKSCMVFIASDRFLGDEQQRKFAGSSRKHPYMIIADTLGCNLRCWFCYSHHFWSLDRAVKHGCNPTFLSSEEIISQFRCKIEKLIEPEARVQKRVEVIKKKLVRKRKKIKEQVYGWILTGSLINWQTALKHNIWGTHAAHKERWHKLKRGDLLFFCVTKPVSGLVGVGITTSKHVGEEILWPDEVETGQVKYPYRWNLKVLYILDQQDWSKDSISLRGPNIQFFSGIDPIFNKKAIVKLKEITMKKWSFNFGLLKDQVLN